MSVRVKLSAIIDGMELLTEEMTSYLNSETGEVVTITDEEFRAAEEEDDSIVDLYGLEKERIKIAMDILYSESDAKYLSLPTKFDINEWAIMKQFCVSVEDEEISQSLLNAIHGRGAFRYLKLPAASSRESSPVRNYVYFLIRSLTPPQAAGNALAVAVQG